MVTNVRCEARKRALGRCRDDAVGLRHVRGQSYLLCPAHARTPLPLLRLEPPLDWEGIQRVYREAHPRARRDGA